MSMRHALCLAALACLLAGCAENDSLSDIQARGELVVVSRNGPTTYYLGRNGPAGFEYALAEQLASELEVKLKMEPAFSLRALFSHLRRREADIAAAGLTLTGKRAAAFPHSIPYDKVRTQVVYRAGRFRPRSTADLPGMSIVTLAGSSHADSLATLRDSALPQLTWREIRGADTMELLEQVREGDAQLALIDSGEFAVQQSLFPRLRVAFDLSDEEDVVWYLPPERDNTRLLVRINAMIDRLRADGTLARLREQHFGHTAGISRIDSHTFTRAMHRALPPWRPLIKRVANEYQMDWQLLAAIAYQESHWDPKAASPTGVRGMMMLTLPTARELGVVNRLDVAQSLRGGARYYKNMKRRLPADIHEPDRTWMALAAYNIGMGHLEDARVLTEHQGGDPHLWREVMERLPLLQKSAYYKSLRYGYARGSEAVTYVQNIRHYYSILQWQEIPGNNAQPPLDIEPLVPEAVREVSLLAL
ncbi:MAG: membrane-bound lytic murein transglycosylase MltF [Halioglobus sp.]|nr:membrane-bound lytic murein transglycosylase MltF [Halioglobus sp.]|tara:strand:+ start:246 stop:1673 length:1428 start_codon:yes stop_codon:yes gene_type:complete